ncbi:MAG TPA: NAD-dependent epimerase/dehydratase family protein [Nonomuraea sp.]|nr:NAD-dependent epimerase/dehydratase family protein [Nonomuraea sp.]
MTRYLVTGATGFVGARLVRMILRRGGTVTALARPSSRALALRALGVQVVEGDLATGAGLTAAVRGADRVIHLAALVKARSSSDYWTVNRDGTARLVHELAAAPGPPRLVVCSSLAAAGPAPAHPGPVSQYGASKLAAEQAVREQAGRLPAIVLRPGIVYGPGEPALFPALIPMIRRGLAVKTGLGPRRYCLLHVDDLCAALLAAAERGTPLSPGDPGRGVYPICDGRVHDWTEICAALAQVMGRRPPVVVSVPMGAVHVAAALTEIVARARGRVPAFNRDKVREMRCASWTCSPEAIGVAVRELGHRPRISLRQGLIATVAGHLHGEDLRT